VQSQQVLARALSASCDPSSGAGFPIRSTLPRGANPRGAATGLAWSGLLGFLLVAAASGWAQGAQSDFDRANGLAERFANKVYRDQVRVRWLPDLRHGWYRVRTGADAHEFVMVDAEAGLHTAAFDHPRLAAALRAAGVSNALPDRLPFQQIEFDADRRRLQFRCAGKTWSWELDGGVLRESAAPAPRTSDPTRPLPKSSTHTGPDTSISFVNRTAAEVELVWLDAEGERRSYGRLRPGESRSQHTFAGHAWLVLGPNGDILTGCQAEEDPITVDITGPAGAVEPQPPPEKAAPERPPGATSPDARWHAFRKDHNVWIRDLSSKADFALSADGTSEAAYAGELHWSPDSRRLVALRVEQHPERKIHLVESSPKDQLQPKLHTIDYAKPGDPIARKQPRLFDVLERKPVPIAEGLFDNPWDLSEFHWSPDSRWFAFLYNQRGHQVLRVVGVDAATGQARSIVDEQSRTFVDYAGKLYLHYLDDSRELIWMSERDGWNHLYLCDAETGQVKNPVTRGEWVVRGVEHVDTERRQIWFRAGGIRPGQDPYFVHVARVNFDGTGLTILTEGNGTHRVAFSPDRRYLVDTWSRVDQPPVTELRRSEDGRLVCTLERADARALAAAGWRAPEAFAATGRDGVTDIYGVIYRPTQFRKGRQYPVIEEIYAGPQDAYVPKGFQVYDKSMSLAELGFIVVQIDGMGTSQRSKAFHDVCWKNLGDAGFPDRIAWLRAAAARHREMDLRRVGIFGGSAGGQNALRALLAHGDFYQVAVADCGCHDNRMDKIWWNELWMGWPVGPHYEEQSNVTQAHRLTGKLLLVVGELDRNVDPASTLQVANALIRADKDFELLLMTGTGHGAAETPYANRRRQEFFVRHLLGVEPRQKR